jgi:hypothetical protein
VRHYSFGKNGGKPVLNATFAGYACDKSNATSCTISYRLDRKTIAPQR